MHVHVLDNCRHDVTKYVSFVWHVNKWPRRVSREIIGFCSDLISKLRIHTNHRGSGTFVVHVHTYCVSPTRHVMNNIRK